MQVPRPDEPPKGYVKLFHGIALLCMGLAAGWAILWAIKLIVAPSHGPKGGLEEVVCGAAGALPLIILAGGFAGLQLLCDRFGHRD